MKWVRLSHIISVLSCKHYKVTKKYLFTYYIALIWLFATYPIEMNTKKKQFTCKYFIQSMHKICAQTYALKRSHFRLNVKCYHRISTLQIKEKRSISHSILIFPYIIAMCCYAMQNVYSVCLEAKSMNFSFEIDRKPSQVDYSRFISF